MLRTLRRALLAMLPAVGPAPVKINLTLLGIHAGKGMVLVRFYDQPDHFLQTVCLQKTQPANQATLTVTAELPAGTYAVAAFQDLDGNGELNLSWLRIPTEPVGFGNNFRPHFAKPTFAACAIRVAERHNTFTIALY